LSGKNTDFVLNFGIEDLRFFAAKIVLAQAVSSIGKDL